LRSGSEWKPDRRAPKKRYELAASHGTSCPSSQILREIFLGTGTRYGGRRVDLRTPEDLSKHFRAEVLRMAEVQYAA
jgi:hypothetical protein